MTVSFGFLEEPNLEKVRAGLASHHEIDLPSDPHLWGVHVSQENLLPSRKLPLARRVMLRVFYTLRHVSQPAYYYYYGLGDEVQLSVEILPVKLG